MNQISAKEGMVFGKSRRRFLSETVFLGAVAAFGGAQGFCASDPISEPTSSTKLNYDTFAQHHNSLFKVDAGACQSYLRLVEVKKLTSEENSSGMRRFDEVFILEFIGNGDAPLKQNTYSFEHPVIGNFDMFIVPMRKEDANVARFAATFYLLAEPSFEGALA